MKVKESTPGEGLTEGNLSSELLPGLGPGFGAFKDWREFSVYSLRSFYMKIIDINIYKHGNGKPLYLSSYVAGWLPKIKSVRIGI